MTEEEFEKLRTWGESLTEDTRAEVRAAGRAILLLTGEVERLQVELWHARLGVEPRAEQPPADAEPRPREIEPELRHQLRGVLLRAGRATRRLQPERLRRRGS